MKLFIIFFLLIFSFISCRKPAITGSKPTATTDSLLTDEIKIKVKEVDIQYFSAKSKINYQDGEENVNALLYTRIQKDSLIWLRVEKISFEGLRALIRPDSVFLWEEQDNNLRELSMDSISRAVNFNLNFKILQAVFLGNMPFLPKSSDKFFKIKDAYLLSQTQERIKIENFVNSKTLKITRLVITEMTTGNFITVDYENFLKVEDILFPHKITITLTNKNRSSSPTTTLTLEHLKLDFPDKELSFPFNLERYREKHNKKNKQ